MRTLLPFLPVDTDDSFMKVSWPTLHYIGVVIKPMSCRFWSNAYE